MGPTILLVEDHDAVRASLRRWLGDVYPNGLLLEARSGEEAVALVYTQAPDVVLMDFRLPQMNGLEATRRIKALAPQAEVVMLTLCDGAIYRDEAARAGASAFVPKDRASTELLPVLTTLLSQPGPSRASV